MVVLPTGTGKTHMANLAIQAAQRPTLVVTPTIDLMNQWFDELTLCFDAEVGLLGGGYYEIKPLTVTTYDSAYMNMDRIGNKFGLLVFDECHHLPGPTYGLASTCAIAPFRLGLTATPERADNAHEQLDRLIGPIVYRKRDHPAPRPVPRRLSRRDPLRQPERGGAVPLRVVPRGLPRPSPATTASTSAGPTPGASSSASPSALPRAAPPTRRTASSGPWPWRRRRSSNLLGRLLDHHHGDRIIIFTHDNATVYQIARRFLVPVITHQTKTKERREILLRFNDGRFPIVATCRVLNEGVNVPEANVAVILSGTGSVREHVQRLGRILRKNGATRRPTLYEVITRGTVEEFTSNRRRQHSAYGGG